MPFSGSVVVGDPTPTESTLLQNTGLALSTPATVASASVVPASPPPPSPPSPSSAASTTAAKDPIPLGTAIGACLSAFVVLVFAVLLAIYCCRWQKRHRKRGQASSRARNAENDTARRRSHLEPWNHLQDVSPSSSQRKQRQIPLPSPVDKLAAMFGRSSTSHSTKSGFVRESFGTLQTFDKYHPNLAAEMASQAVDVGDQIITRPAPVRTFLGRLDMGPAVSWDGETLKTDSFRSGQSGLPVAAPMLSKEKMTPVAIVSDAHHWERAEVLHTDHSSVAASSSQDPFTDTSSASLKRAASNPFFNAQEKASKRTPATNPFGDPPSSMASVAHSAVSLPLPPPPPSDARALESLIAALETAPPSDIRSSLQSSIYSQSTFLQSDVDESTVIPCHRT